MSSGDWFGFWSLVIVATIAWLMLDWMGDQ